MPSVSIMEMPELCATTAHLPPTVKALTSTSEMDTLIDTSLEMRRSKSGWTTCYDGSWITADSWRGEYSLHIDLEHACP